MDKEEALYRFWASFGLPAYDENIVPDDAELPYITFEAAVSDFDREIPLTASLWYRSDVWDDVIAKAKEIVAAIGKGGKIVNYDGGAMWIKTSSPQYQRMSEPADDTVRRIRIDVTIEFID